MAKAKKKSVLGFVLFGLVVVALVLVIVGMCVDVIQQTVTTTVLGNEKVEQTSFNLFADKWTSYKDNDIVSNVFLIISFVVTLVGLVLVAIDYVLRLFLNKDCKFCRIIGAALTLIGAILILVAGLTTVGTLNDKFSVSGGIEGFVTGEYKYSAFTGVWLGFVGGLVGAVAGALPISKKFA